MEDIERKNFIEEKKRERLEKAKVSASSAVCSRSARGRPSHACRA